MAVVLQFANVTMKPPLESTVNDTSLALLLAGASQLLAVAFNAPRQTRPRLTERSVRTVTLDPAAAEIRGLVT